MSDFDVYAKEIYGDVTSLRYMFRITPPAALDTWQQG